MTLRYGLRAGLAALGLLLLGLGAWLALPRAAAGDASLPGARVVLLDVSASVVRSRRGLAGQYWNLLQGEAQAAAAAGQDLVVVRMAAAVKRLLGPIAADRWPQAIGQEPWQPLVARGDDMGTSLDQAVQAAEAWLLDPRRDPGELVLVTDGTWTGSDPRTRLRGLTLAGNRVRRLPLPKASVADVAITELAGPHHVPEGLPVTLRLDWRGRQLGGAAVSLELELMGPESRRRLVQVMEPSSSGQQQRSSVPLGVLTPGLWTVEARLRAGAADRTPEDDRALLRLRVGTQPVVGMLAPKASAQALRSLWTEGAPRGLQFEWCAPAEAGGRLDAWDAVVSLDLGPADLPRDAMLRFVRAGGGWLAMGGVGLLDGWGAGELGKLLPLEPRAEDREPREVVLLVDGSGSMNEREPGATSRWEKVRRAVVGLVSSVPAQDRVQLWFFTGDLIRPPVLDASGAEGRERSLAELLRVQAPGGVTNIVDSLHRLILDREARPEIRRALVVLLSDGYQNGDSFRTSEELRTRLAATGGELRVLAIGERPNFRFLERLSGEQHPVIRGGDLSDLERLLVEEVFSERVRREPGLAAQFVAPEQLVPGGAGRLLLETLGSLEPWPPRPMAAYLRAQAREGASPPPEVLLVGSEGEPILALGEAGLGRVACLATLPQADWCEGLRARPGMLGPLLLSLVERGLGALEPKGPRARLDRGQLIVSGLEPGAPGELRALPPGWATAAGEGAEQAWDQGLVLGPSPKDPDPGRRRVAQVPAAWLADSPLSVGSQAMGAREILLLAQGREWLRLPLERGTPEELLGAGPQLPEAWPEPGPGRPEGPPGPHPASAALLAMGLVGMACAVLVRRAPGQGVGSRRVGGQGMG